MLCFPVGHCARHCPGTVRALSGHCPGTVRALSGCGLGIVCCFGMVLVLSGHGSVVLTHPPGVVDTNILLCVLWSHTGVMQGHHLSMSRRTVDGQNLAQVDDVVRQTNNTDTLPATTLA